MGLQKNDQAQKRPEAVLIFLHPKARADRQEAARAFPLCNMEKNKSTIGSFFGGVLSTVVGIISLGIFVGGAVWVARKIAGPAKYVVVDETVKK